jgi:hypothetical protein
VAEGEPREHHHVHGRGGVAVASSAGRHGGACPILSGSCCGETMGSSWEWTSGEERGEVRTEERWPMEHKHDSTGGSHV